MIDPSHILDPSNITSLVASILLIIGSIIPIPWVFSGIALGILFYRIIKGILDAFHHREHSQNRS